MKKVVGIVIGVLVIVGLVFFGLKSMNTNGLKFGGKEISLLLNQVNDQKKINERLEKIAKDSKYTFENPYVELNPYNISPLSAIIIFNTSEEYIVDVFINDNKVTSMESSITHIIPIYGLREDYENKVVLSIKGDEKEIIIKTEKSNIEYPLEVPETTHKLNNEEMYFTVASYKTYVTAWDNLGYLRFYLTVDNRMDIEWLDNGHFLVGVSDGQFAENFLGFVEMDYLGKIYNYYTTDHGYSFEFQVLSNGDYMMTGGNKPVYIDEQYIYTLNPKTGEITSSLNLAEAMLKVDPKFDKVVLGQKAIRNAFAYNEETDELILSFRGQDAVISFNYKTGDINWVFTDPNNELFKNDVWKDYLVNLKSGRYPQGQHSVILTSDGNVGFFNNGYNRYHGFENGGNDLVSFYKDNYASGEIYKIENKVATLVLSVDLNKSLFSHQYGSIKELSNGNYLVDFGYNLKNEYRKSSTGTLSAAEASPDNIFARIVEVDKKGNIVFTADCEEGKFRAFKHSIYNETTINTDVTTLNIFNNIEKDKLNEIRLSNIDYKNASEWINDVSLTLNAFKTNYEIKDKDVVKFYFVNKNEKAYEFTYKESDSKRVNRIFNLDLKKGSYKVFISINDTLYELNNTYTV